ncbi:MAG TPA: hypothetical protein VLW83_03330, partial [Candidatus Acidoferrales bacterium]|nr:hypothetical protein [Candidatus Acidoferrales bacterium]
MRRAPLRLSIWVLAILIAIPFSALSLSPRPDVLLQTMQRELQRATSALAKSDPAPYYLSYSVVDSDGLTIAGMDGGLVGSAGSHRRQADVMMRV